jgi:hypothetical protein
MVLANMPAQAETLSFFFVLGDTINLCVCIRGGILCASCVNVMVIRLAWRSYSGLVRDSVFCRVNILPYWWLNSVYMF